MDDKTISVFRNKHEGGEAICYALFHTSKNPETIKKIGEFLAGNPHTIISSHLCFIYTDVTDFMIFMNVGTAVEFEEEVYLMRLSPPFQLSPQPDSIREIALRLPSCLRALDGIVEVDPEKPED